MSHAHVAHAGPRRLASTWLSAALLAVLAAGPASGADTPADGASATAPAAVSGAGPVVGKRPAFRCDGTDAYFFRELEAAGKVGYGETWDAKLCDEGVAVYAEGATSKWAAFRRPRRATDEEQALALVLPLTLGGGITVVVGTAALLAFIGRLRRRTVLVAPCPSCAAELPVEDGAATQLFCPMCGTACAITIQGKGKGARAHASPLA